MRLTLNSDHEKSPEAPRPAPGPEVTASINHRLTLLQRVIGIVEVTAARDADLAPETRQKPLVAVQSFTAKAYPMPQDPEDNWRQAA